MPRLHEEEDHEKNKKNDCLDKRWEASWRFICLGRGLERESKLSWNCEKGMSDRTIG